MDLRQSTVARHSGRGKVCSGGRAHHPGARKVIGSEFHGGNDVSSGEESTKTFPVHVPTMVFFVPKTCSLGVDLFIASLVTLGAMMLLEGPLVVPDPPVVSRRRLGALNDDRAAEREKELG